MRNRKQETGNGSRMARWDERRRFGSLSTEDHDAAVVVGVFGHPEAANLVYLGLYALQHRGQESAGIVSAKDDILISHRGLGLVADIFNEDIIRQLEGTAAIGHNRYSTSGQTLLKNTQPFVVEYGRGGLAVAHNGNLVNAVELREQLEAARVDLPVERRHRGDRPSDGGVERRAHGRSRGRGAARKCAAPTRWCFSRRAR